MNKKLLLILSVALVVLIAGASVLYQGLRDYAPAQQLATVPQQPTEPSATASTTAAATEEPIVIHAIDFTVYDAEGNPVRLSDFYGKPIVLNFWASWCGPCKSEMADFNEASQRLEGQVQFLMINMTDGSRETVQTAQAFLDTTDYTFPVYFDTAFEAAVAYNIYSLPTTFFINAEGNLVAYAERAIDAQLLQTGIDMITD